MAHISWNYTTWLNIAFLLLAVVLVVRFLRTGGPAMLKMMDGGPDDMAARDHSGRDHSSHDHSSHDMVSRDRLGHQVVEPDRPAPRNRSTEHHRDVP